jgi:ABC-type multidrug transport system ATPase subunit
MSSVLLADEVVHLAGGRVVDHGTHAELLARDPGYAELATAYEQESERRAARRAEALDAEAAAADERADQAEHAEHEDEDELDAEGAR